MKMKAPYDGYGLDFHGDSCMSNDDNFLCKKKTMSDESLLCECVGLGIRLKVYLDSYLGF